MKMLVLGGTRFLGRHLVDAARARGHRPTRFNRGRSWDAVIDTCGYLPRLVRRSAEVLRDAVGRYLFVSSISVNADLAAPQLDEQAPLASSPDLHGEDVAQHYGALKAACEGEVAALFGARAILVRPGLIVGLFDPTGRFTYWVQRVAQGGTILAPPTPEYPLQFIDGRDLATWLLDPVERGGNGAYNACGPGAADDVRRIPGRLPFGARRRGRVRLDPGRFPGATRRGTVDRTAALGRRRLTRPERRQRRAGTVGGPAAAAARSDRGRHCPLGRRRSYLGAGRHRAVDAKGGAALARMAPLQPPMSAPCGAVSGASFLVDLRVASFPQSVLASPSPVFCCPSCTLFSQFLSQSSPQRVRTNRPARRGRIPRIHRR
jgi:nucleoside-diphosphate-sugar epimerase